MALQLADRVQQTGTANTTVSFNLSGSVSGYQSFSSAITTGNTTYYAASDGTNWEVGIGTLTSSSLLTRTTIISSSNSGSAVSTFGSSINIFVTQPAENTVVSSNNPGINGYVLTSQGTGVAPIWAAGGVGTITTTDFTATSGQTVFTVTYTVGLVSVYRNGIKLGAADYTATNGTSITLATGAITGDLIEVEAFSSLNLTTAVSSFSAGTTGFTPSTATTGAVTLAGTLNIANGGTGVTTSTGSGNNVLSTSPTLVTPALGTPSALVLTNATGLPSSALPTGSVLQVINVIKTDTSSTSSQTYSNISGLSATITPKNSSNKILVFLNIDGSNDGGNMAVQLLRNSTPIAIGTGATGVQLNVTLAAYYNNADANKHGSAGITYLDSPATTSAVTYQAQFRTGNTGNSYVNRSTGTDNALYNLWAVSTITVMEIAG